MPRLSGIALAIVIANVGLSFMAALAGHVGDVRAGVDSYLLLTPALFVHGYVWQALTYSFFDFGALSLLFSSLPCGHSERCSNRPGESGVLPSFILGR